MPKLIRISLWLVLYVALSGFVVVGHRGDPLKYPEQTFESDDAAFAAGANYVELDVQESKDGVLVIQHDPTLLRTTGADVTIASSNFAQIQQYHTKNGEPIHSLQELFAHYQHSKRRFLIETKIESGVPHPQMEQKIAALVTRYHMQSRVMFHSFSLKSLKRLQKLLPNVPRIFIVGSLKRITFAVFPYVTGINVSSTLVTPALVSDLHHIGQKVYVWDEMNESRKKWHWLANINIDGVVTNYPGLAHEYQALTAAAQSHPVDALATNTSTRALPVYTNPYTPTVRRQTIAPGATFTVQKAVTLDHEVYYQLGPNRFISATTVNLAPLAGWADLLRGKRATAAATDRLAATVHPAPNAHSGTCGTLINGQTQRIQAVKIQGQRVWCRLDGGWVSAHQLRLQPNAGHDRNWLAQFNANHTLTHPHLGLGQMACGLLAPTALNMTVSE